MKSQQEMTFVDHLQELRKRIIRIVLVLVVAMILGLVLAKPIIVYLKAANPASQLEWNVFSPWDSIRIYMNVSFLFAMIVSLPFALYQLWLFMKPGLKEHEQKAAVGFIPLATLLCIAGLAFGYFVVFPLAFYFSNNLTTNLGLTETYGISQYFSFMFNILIPLTLVFELPIVILFLTKIRLINPLLLRRMRRIAYLLMVVLGTLITPPDLLSAIIVAVPFILLYETSVWVSAKVYKRQLAQDFAEEE